MTSNHHLGHIVSVIVTSVAAVATPALAPGGALAAYSWAPLALAILVYVARLVRNGPFPPAAAVALLTVFLAGGCSHVLGPVPTPGTPGFVNCSDAAIHQAALNILPSVENALAVDGYEAKLATLIASLAGPLALAEVECAVAWVESKAERDVTVTADSLSAAQAAHAKAWLAAHPVTFTPAGP